MIAYIALFSTLLSRLTALACGSAWVTSFIVRFLNIHQSGVLTALAWLVPHETAAVSAQVLCTPYNHAPCHFMQSHIRKVYACLAVTCHLHFWQNDRDLLCATVVTLGWNRYRNKSQHRKSTLEKKILQPLQQGFEPATFQSRVRRSNHWAIPAPPLVLCFPSTIHHSASPSFFKIPPLQIICQHNSEILKLSKTLAKNVIFPPNAIYLLLTLCGEMFRWRGIRLAMYRSCRKENK